MEELACFVLNEFISTQRSRNLFEMRLTSKPYLLANDHDPSKLVARHRASFRDIWLRDDSHIDADSPYAEVEVMKMCMPLLSLASESS
ncbi:hypothetical protein K1719_046906 [Acacia pycnantha]|nr:hypothetical protein K1719_046906 [Acacia pycnantha]